MGACAVENIAFFLQAGDAAYLYNHDCYLFSKTDGAAVTQYAYSSRGELEQVNLPDGTVVEGCTMGGCRI